MIQDIFTDIQAINECLLSLINDVQDYIDSDDLRRIGFPIGTHYDVEFSVNNQVWIDYSYRDPYDDIMDEDFEVALSLDGVNAYLNHNDVSGIVNELKEAIKETKKHDLKNSLISIAQSIAMTPEFLECLKDETLLEHIKNADYCNIKKYFD